MEITVHIQAPELVQAVNNLASSISSTKGLMPAGIVAMEQPDPIIYPALTAAAGPGAIQQPAQQTIQQPVQQTFQQQPLPTGVPTMPIQQTQQPVQQNPFQQAPVQQQGFGQAPQQLQGVPTTTHTYTQEQLGVAATQLMDAGKQNELVQLLHSFGVQALTALPLEQYGAFATKLREMGAKL